MAIQSGLALNQAFNLSLILDGYATDPKSAGLVMQCVGSLSDKLF